MYRSTAVGWASGYTNAIPHLLEQLAAPRKGLIGRGLMPVPQFAPSDPQTPHPIGPERINRLSR